MPVAEPTRAERREQHLVECNRLAELFRGDREAFERERKRLLDTGIANMHNRIKMRAQQDALDEDLL